MSAAEVWRGVALTLWLMAAFETWRTRTRPAAGDSWAREVLAALAALLWPAAVVYDTAAAAVADLRGPRRGRGWRR